MPSYKSYSTPELYTEHALISSKLPNGNDDNPTFWDFCLMCIEEEMHERASTQVHLSHGIVWTDES